MNKAVYNLRSLKAKSEDYWIKRGEAMVMRLFRDMSIKIPAYKDFLKKNKVKISQIKNISDLKYLPLLDKNNYLKFYELKYLCWPEVYKKKSFTFSATSGTTGKSYYFPRTNEQDACYAYIAEMYLRENFQIHKKSTLYINAFALGVWIGGLFTHQTILKIAAKKEYRLSIISPGVNKEEIIGAIVNIGSLYDQVIIGGYPPFVKDLIDYGNEHKINWETYNLGIIFSAEGFSEEFRTYIFKEAKLSNVFKSTLNHYGTVDLGTMAHETPFAIFLRRRAMQDKKLYKFLFGTNQKIPTLTQFMPELYFFEQVNDGLVCSSYSGIPLVRYDLKDRGAIIRIQDLGNFSDQNNLNLFYNASEEDINILNIPFVHVFERDDLSITFYGLNIYPETIRKALSNRTLINSVSGKFTMLTKRDKKQNQFIEINVELRRGVESNQKIKHQIRTLVLNTLIKYNSEFNKLYHDLPEINLPTINLFKNGDETYFKAQGKQKWILKI